MNVVIIEDETAAAVNLRSILEEVAPSIEVLAVLESVVDSVQWIRTNPSPDLILMDIHLADGDAFKIFNRVEVKSPIIFTTAYDQYALDAFKVNSIDYILKPIKADDVKRALDKLERLSGSDIKDYAVRVADVSKNMNSPHSFLVHMKDKIFPLKLEDIALCYTENEKVTAYTTDGRQLPVDGSLDGIMNKLPEDDFFRANRQFIVSRNGIKDISIWFGSRLCVNMILKTSERIIISKARVPDFKKWLAQ